MPADPPRAAGGSTTQVAARLLLLLDRLGQPPSTAELSQFPDAIKVVRSTSRLAKLDFWMRNPDYLADELLNDIDSGQLEPTIGLTHVARMLAGEAPVLHTYPMQRYKYGAWELPDNAMAVLKSLGLLRTRRASDADAANAGRARRDFFLLQPGADVVARMRSEVEQTAWYDAQADAIALLHIGDSGASVKPRQYEQPEYAETRIGTTIGPILDRTRQRFEAVALTHGFLDAALTEQAPGQEAQI